MGKLTRRNGSIMAWGSLEAPSHLGSNQSMAEDILKRVVKVVCEELGVTENEVQESSVFTDDLGADSLDVVELVMALEEEFSIDIPDDDVANMKTVGDVKKYIEEKAA